MIDKYQSPRPDRETRKGAGAGQRSCGRPRTLAPPSPSCVTYYAITPLCLVGQGVPLWNPRYCDTSRFSLLLRCNAPHRYCDPSQFPVTVTPPPAPLGIRPVTVIVLPLLCLMMRLNRVFAPLPVTVTCHAFRYCYAVTLSPVTVTSHVLRYCYCVTPAPLFLAYAPRCLVNRVPWRPDRV